MPMHTSPYSSGTPLRWAYNMPYNDYWRQFKVWQTGAPATAIWFQLCLKAGDGYLASRIAAVAIARLAARETGAPVYVSAINGFSEGTCSLVGPDGVNRSARLRDELVAHGIALRGPDMPSLSYAELEADRCHPNAAGQARIGEALLGFFG